MKKLNCWEFKKCGRELGGINSDELGVCPSATEKKADGINKGLNAGRVCWAVSGTFCQGKVQGSFAMKMERCTECDFYQLTRKEEGLNFDLGSDLLEKIYSPKQLTQIYDQLHYVFQNIQELQVQLVSNEKLAGLGQLAAGIAHEINNPMAFVSSNLNILAKYADTINKSMDNLSRISREINQTESENFLNRISELDATLNDRKLNYILEDIEDILKESLDGVKRVNDIVKNLKIVSRLDESPTQNVNINDCLERSLELAKSSFSEKCQVVKEFNPLPFIKCQPAEIEQAFVNMINNAAYAVSDGGKIVIRTEVNKEEITVLISDTGNGIPKEILHKIFDPFFTSKPIGTGTGLGLSVAQQIIKGHGGSIEVKSESGKGATFIVRIPV